MKQILTFVKISIRVKLMFEKIKSTFKGFMRQLTQKEITEESLSKILWDLELNLVTNDVASQVAREISLILKEKLVGKMVRRLTDYRKIALDTLRKVIINILKYEDQTSLEKEILQRKEQNITNIAESKSWYPYIILFLGPNGSGKTTTIAKLAWKFKKKGISSVLVASDTFRAGAIEQLKKHAERVGASFISRPYGSDPASVAYDAINHAKARRKDLVLIDTAGRLGTNIDLMEEMKKINRVSKPDKRILVVDALSGNDLVVQATEFKNAVGIDGNILTKVDADVKGGAAITLAYITKAPILYVGTGQNYDDLTPFDPKWFIDNILP